MNKQMKAKNEAIQRLKQDNEDMTLLLSNDHFKSVRSLEVLEML